jgi:hypothetical protein
MANHALRELLAALMLMQDLKSFVALKRFGSFVKCIKDGSRGNGHESNQRCKTKHPSKISI